MSGTPEGAVRCAAKRIGVSEAEYRARVNAGQKWCCRHRAWHSRKAFGVDRSRYDGLSSKCRAALIRMVDSPGQHERTKARARGAAWCRYCAAWLPVHLVRGGICREHANAEARAHYAMHATEQIQRKMPRRRHLTVIPGWWRNDLFESFNRACAYGCGRPAASLDHVWPVASGGRSTPGNLVPACLSCNSSKNARHPKAWVERGMAAFPDQWLSLLALAIEHNVDEWMEPVA